MKSLLSICKVFMEGSPGIHSIMLKNKTFHLICITYGHRRWGVGEGLVQGGNQVEGDNCGGGREGTSVILSIIIFFKEGLSGLECSAQQQVLEMMTLGPLLSLGFLRIYGFWPLQ